MEKSHKIILGVTAVALVAIGVPATLVTRANEERHKCYMAITDWELALSRIELGRSAVRLADATGEQASYSDIQLATGNDTKERQAMKQACSPEAYLQAIETQAAEDRLDKARGL